MATNALDKNQPDTIRGYYKLHATIYDNTRWTFLFGRRRILHELGLAKDTSARIVEIGCGTGRNLAELAKIYPNAALMGIDVSEDMLQVARKKLGSRVELQQLAYGTEGHLQKKADVILFSYCLTMVNPDWQKLLDQTALDLKDGGVIAVVDFHYSASAWFRRWMGVNHVRMERHLQPILARQFTPIVNRVEKAYMGWWEYFTFVGTKK